MDAFTRGQFVRITYNGRTVDGMVLLASTNSASLMLGFDGALVPSHGEGMLMGSMPVLRDDRGVYRDLLSNETVQIVHQGSH